MLAGVRFLDTGTRAYILAVHNDLFACVIIPCSILFAAPSIRSACYLLIPTHCIHNCIIERLQLSFFNWLPKFFLVTCAGSASRGGAGRGGRSWAGSGGGQTTSHAPARARTASRGCRANLCNIYEVRVLCVLTMHSYQRSLNGRLVSCASRWSGFSNKNVTLKLI